MIKVSNIETFNFDGAIRGMRNPLSSWHLSDSKWDKGHYIIGEKDLNLMQRLYKAGNDHRKYLRQIFITMDITAPLYFWKQLDTYKVGTVANSTSTMHKIMAKEFTGEDFSYDDYDLDNLENLGRIEKLLLEYAVEDINRCNNLRNMWLSNNKDKRIWRKLIQTLPSSYNQTRTFTMNYENAYNMYFSRKNHKLTEWHELCRVFETLPYFKDIAEL